jgi:CheY-like chemotaxis protein
VYATSFQSRPKILCIDDDSAVTTAIRLRLEYYDVDVLTATNGSDGLWLAMTEHPNVIITDLRMPHGGGDYMVECLRGHIDVGDIPVITITGKSDNAAKRWMKTLGVRHYLHKPLQITKLLSAIEDYVALNPAAHPL